MVDEVKLLPVELKKNGYYYIQIARTEEKALYGQCHTAGTDPFAYEAFFIRKQLPSTTTIAGQQIVFEHKEIFPNDEEFGKTAWSFQNREIAMKFYTQMRKYEN